MAKQRNNYFSRNRNPYQRRSWLWYLKAFRKWEDKFVFLLHSSRKVKQLRKKIANSCCFGHLVFVYVAGSALGLTQAWSNPLTTRLLPVLRPISLNSSRVKVWRIPSCFYKEFLLWWHEASQQREVRKLPTNYASHFQSQSLGCFSPKAQLRKTSHYVSLLVYPHEPCLSVLQGRCFSS